MNGTDDGDVQFLIALEDMTDRVAAEWRYRYLMDHANDAVFILDAATGTITEANTKAAEMIGLYDKSGLVGTSVSLIHPADFADVAKAHLQVTLERGWNLFEDLPLVRTDGFEVRRTGEREGYRTRRRASSPQHYPRYLRKKKGGARFVGESGQVPEPGGELA